ncbi:MAG TPA: hemerythrin domain-containing protein [Bryobacteraceae bacterium]|nr:hemerythrin domain-containing protein [Bryobacteraceae bacterium]
MPITIGAKPEATFADPIGMLKDCHRRIERFLNVLAQLSPAAGRPLDPAQRASFETALQYFREAAPKHTADEEDSLFPRLRAKQSTGVQSAFATLDSLHHDHARADALHAEVDRLGRAWLAQGTLPPADSARFSELIAELVELYRAHIAVEETDLFPVAAAALETPERQAMGAEMAARRGLQSR